MPYIQSIAELNEIIKITLAYQRKDLFTLVLVM